MVERWPAATCAEREVSLTGSGRKRAQALCSKPSPLNQRLSTGLFRLRSRHGGRWQADGRAWRPPGFPPPPAPLEFRLVPGARLA